MKDSSLYLFLLFSLGLVSGLFLCAFFFQERAEIDKAKTIAVCEVLDHRKNCAEYYGHRGFDPYVELINTMKEAK